MSLSVCEGPNLARVRQSSTLFLVNAAVSTYCQPDSRRSDSRAGAGVRSESVRYPGMQLRPTLAALLLACCCAALDGVSVRERPLRGSAHRPQPGSVVTYIKLSRPKTYFIRVIFLRIQRGGAILQSFVLPRSPAFAPRCMPAGLVAALRHHSFRAHCCSQ